MSANKFSEALLYFLDEETLCDALDFPDTGIDYAYMMNKSDWETLLTKWDLYSDTWKIAVTYFAGFSYLKESASILFKALDSTNDELVSQALFSLHESIYSEIESENYKREKEGKAFITKIDFSITAENKLKALSQLHSRSHLFETHSELKKLQDILNQLP